MGILLTLDAGNTVVKCAGYQLESGTFLSPFRISLNYQDPAECFQRMLVEFERQDCSPGQWQGISYCSVVPAFDDTFDHFITKCFTNSARPPVFKADPVRLEGANSVKSPVSLEGYPLEQLGADRWVDLVAVRVLYPDQPAIVMDFGTATTIDALSAQGCFLGGVIVPGWKLFAEALPKATAKLPSVIVDSEKLFVPSLLGKNTQACLKGGLVVGYLGLLKEVLSRMSSEISNITQEQSVSKGSTLPWVIATGGDSEAIAPLMGGEGWQIRAVIPLLTQIGLVELFRLNMPQMVIHPFTAEPANYSSISGD